MAPYLPSPVIKYSVPTVIILLSYFLFRRRKIGVRSDTGGTKPIEEFNAIQEESVNLETVDSAISTPEKVQRAQSTPIPTPSKKLNRSLSGVETAPIDIVYPPELRSAKSAPVVIPDEELDQEIEKIKSMRSQYHSPSSISAHLSNTSTPETEKANTEIKSTPEATPNDNTNNSITIKETFEHSVINISSNKKNNKMAKKGNLASVAKTDTIKKNKSKKKDKKQENTCPEKSQKEVAVVEQKIKALKITKTEIPQKEEVAEIQISSQEKTEELIEHHEVGRKNSGRDSANHSPSDVMMASPSLSSMSDNHSEGSSDSGKGGSDVATPPSSRTPQMNMNPNMPLNYEFVIPQNLVGKLIGRQGSFVQSIKEKCNANVCIRRYPNNNRLKMCSIEGNQTEIDKALKMIRDKFPIKKYSEVTLEQVQLGVSTVPLSPDCLYLNLVEGINNDTILSCMITPNHLFMQQPTHPSFPSLNMLSNCMNSCYNTNDSPLLPSPIPANTICVAYSLNSWCRAIVLSTNEETDTSYVKFLDYGGYSCVKNDTLRQIRHDFILLPFQAAECVLSNIKSINEDGSWASGAHKLVADITKGSIIYTQIADYTPEGIPLVLCYVVSGHTDLIFLNKRLVDEGYAVWTDLEDPQTPTESTHLQNEENV